MANDSTKNEASGVIKSVSRETRRFPPPKDFAKRALIKDAAAYEKMYRRSNRRSGRLLGRDGQGGAHLDQAVGQGGHLESPLGALVRRRRAEPLRQLPRSAPRRPRGDKVALDWEGEPGDSRKLTYLELHAEVCKLANVMKGLGVVAGDRVAIYMAMVPEAAIAMLACARIGATHTVIFGGFSARGAARPDQRLRREALHHADGGWRRGKSCRSRRTSTRPSPRRRRSRAARRAPHRRRRRDEGRPRPLVGRADEGAPRARVPRRPASPPSTRSSSSTRRARPGSRRASSTRPPATCWART